MRTVTGAIVFLASDEMGGRGTPSPEFHMATAYVAARFQGAGLTGGGDDGFYQVAEIDTVQQPDSGVLFNGPEPVENFGLLNAADQRYTFQGELAVADLTGSESYSGPVVLSDVNAYSDRRGLFTLMRDVNQLQQRGATAVVLPVEPENELVAAARSAQQRPRTGRRSRWQVPVLLVDKNSRLTGKFDIDFPAAIRTQTPIRNVIGVLPGSDPELAKEAVVFSAHLDHLGTVPGGKDPIYNGADDDASGVTAVLSLADAFSALKERPKRSTIFMTFWGEEQGLLGSQYFAQHPLWPLDKIVANVNIEMVGRPESGARNKVWETGWDRSNLGPLMALGAKRVGTIIFEHPRYSAGLYRQSDNWSLDQKGVIAHSFSAGSLHEDYHQPSDEWQKLDLDHMTSVIRGLFAGALPIARDELTPTAAENEK